MTIGTLSHNQLKSYMLSELFTADCRPERISGQKGKMGVEKFYNSVYSGPAIVNRLVENRKPGEKRQELFR
jgi:hypothetical protein